MKKKRKEKKTQRKSFGVDTASRVLFIDRPLFYIFHKASAFVKGNAFFSRAIPFPLACLG